MKKDFLDLDKWNIKQVTLDNYEIKRSNRSIGEAGLNYDDSEWKLSGSVLSEDEELIRIN